MRLPTDYTLLTPYIRRKVREEYTRRQKGLCYYCKQPLTGLPHPKVRALPIPKNVFPANFFKYPVHLHHNHDTRMTIGAVHCLCNAVLFVYEGE